MSNLKLEVGKFYRTRNGQKGECIFFRQNGVRVNKRYSAIVIFEDQNYLSYTGTGCFLVDGQGHELDIISEWEETPEETSKRIGFDPSCLPAWGIQIAMDEDGKWKYYDNEPVLDDLCFFVESGLTGKIPEEYAPTNFTGHWTESKFKVK